MATTTPGGVDVLVAEDSRMQAKLLLKRLTAAGHVARWAENGADALTMARERRPDIIISGRLVLVGPLQRLLQLLHTEHNLRERIRPLTVCAQVVPDVVRI